MDFGLTENTIIKIRNIFQSFNKIEKVVIFGSRVKGNYKEGSDIDLAVKGDLITYNDMLSINVKLDDLDLPYKIDLIDYSSIKEPSLTEQIDRIGLIFFSREEKTWS